MESKQKTPGKRGRQPDASSKSGQIRELLSTNMSVKEIAEKLKCTPALVYNVKARTGGGSGNKPRRGPGRPPKAAAPTKISVAKMAEGGLEGIVAMVRQSESQRAQLRQALERIQGILADALR